MSVQGWMMQGASTTSCDLVFRIGSEVGGTTLAKTTDVDVTLVMDDVGLTVSDSGTINYSDLDNDGSRDCFGRFHVSGGSEGNTYAGTLTSESDGVAVRVQVKTIPNGRIKKADISCDGTWNSEFFNGGEDIQGGANNWLPIAQKIVTEGVHYVNLIDDAYYLWSSWDAGEVDFAPPANTSSFVSPNILAVDDHTNNIVNASSAGSASDENAAIYRHVRTAFLHPAFQLLGQHCPINFSMGDHEFVANDFKWQADPNVPQGPDFDTTQKCADAGELCMSVWQNAFYPSNPTKYTTAATTAEYPKRLTRNEADTADVNPVTEYGVTAANFYPHSQVVKNDIMADYLPDVMRHRGRADVDDSMLGSQGYTDLVAALASHDAGGSEPLPYVHVSIAKQFYRMIRETNDSMVDDSPTEAGNLQTALKARDKAIVCTSGDIHGAQQLIDGNVLASCVSAVSSNVTLITDLVAVWDKTGDFATDPGENVSNIHAGTKDTSKAALGNHSRYSYGITEYAPHKATHRLMDWRGNVIGGVVEIKPYNTAIFYESNLIYSGAVNTMNQIDVDITASTVGLDHGVGEIQSGVLNNDVFPLYLGEADGDGKYDAVIAGVGADNTGGPVTSKGASIMIDTDLSRGVFGASDLDDLPASLSIEVFNSSEVSTGVLDNTVFNAVNSGLTLANGNTGKVYRDSDNTTLMVGALPYKLRITWQGSGSSGGSTALVRDLVSNLT